MKKLLLALALLLLPTVAFAQCNGIFGANQVCGSLAGGVPGPVNAVNFPIGLKVGTSTITGGSATGVLYNNSGVLGADAGLTWVPGGPLTINPTGGNAAISAQFFDANSGIDILVLPQGAPGSYSAPHAISGTNRYGPTADSSDNPDGIYGILWYTSAHNFTGAGAALRGNAYTVPVITAAIANGGSGNQVGDILTIVGGTCNTDLNVPPTFAVSAVSGGAVTAVTSSNQQACTVYPNNPVTTTSSRGGATPPALNLTVALSPNVTSLIGAYGRARHTSKGTVTNAIALQGDGCYNAGGGTVTNCMAAWLQPPYDAPTNSYGAYFAGTFNQGALAYANGSTFTLSQAGGGTSQLNIRRLDNGGAGNTVAQVVFQGQNSTPTTVNYGYWSGFANVVTPGAESGSIFGHTLRAGIDTNEISIGGGVGIGISGNVGGVGTLTVDKTAVVGTTGTTTGTIGFIGATSGTATITAQAAAGTPTITLPNATGTFAVGASAPLALNATTGNLTCPTCATTTNGGALSATAPITISASGVIALSLDSTLRNNAGSLGLVVPVIVASGGTNCTSASITCFNNITGFAAVGATGTTSTNLVFSTSPTLVTPILGVATATSINGLVITTTLGTLTISNNASAALITSGNFALTLTATATTNATFPSGTGTLAYLAGTNSWLGVNSFTNTTQSTSTSTGAVVISGGVAINKALTLGSGTGTVNSGPVPDLSIMSANIPLEINLATSNNNPFTFLSSDGTTYFIFDINRRTATGVFQNTSATHSRIQMLSGNGSGVIQLYTTNSNNSQAATGVNVWGSLGISVGNNIDAGLGAVNLVLHSTSKGATITATAPGAGNGALIFACGTNAGTAAIYIGAGTSTTYTRLIDSVGASVTGC